MRIGDLAAEVGVNPKTIRYYEQIGLLPDPARTSSGYREYDQTDLERLVFVRTAQRLSLSLAEIREILAFRDRGERPCGYVVGVLDRQVTELDRRIAELTALRSDLVALNARTDELGDVGSVDGSFCTVIEHAAAMASVDELRRGPGSIGVEQGPATRRPPRSKPKRRTP